MDNGEKLLAIFEAYNLCDAREIGQLVCQEMLVALGKQDDIDWDCIIDGGLAHAKERYQNVHNMVKKQCIKVISIKKPLSRNFTASIKRAILIIKV